MSQKVAQPKNDPADNDEVRLQPKWLTEARWLMDPEQRALTNPADYDLPIDPELIKKEIPGATPDPEMREYMMQALSGFGPGRELTIRALVDQMDSLTPHIHRAVDADLRETLVVARLGDEAVVNHLIRRANALAKTVKPGANDLLGGAFGG
jgi:hypothetical protein